MSLSGQIVAPAPPFDKLAIEQINCQDFFHAAFCIRNLSIKHDVCAVQRHLLLHPHPDLWLTFLQNKDIWPAIDQETLDNMNRYTYKMIGSLTIDNPWNAVHKALMANFKQITYVQTTNRHAKLSLIESIEPGESFDAIFEDILRSDNVDLWFAFASNPAIFLILLNEQNYQLVQTLMNRVATQTVPNESWVVLLTLFTLKGYPLNYVSILKQLPQCYSIMLNYAVSKIANHGRFRDNHNRTEAVKWLKFLITFSFDDEGMLSLVRQNTFLRSLPPHYLEYLSTHLVYQFIQIFPDNFSLALEHIHTQMLQIQVGNINRQLQEVVKLVKAFESDPKFRDRIYSDTPCVTLLKYAKAMSEKYHLLPAKTYTPAFEDASNQASTLIEHTVDAFAEPPPLTYGPLLRKKLS